MEKKDFDKLLEDIPAKGLTVRDLEAMTKKLSEKPSEKKPRPDDIYYAEIENTIAEKWGRKVKISAAKNKGKIELEFYDKEDFEALIHTLQTVS